MERLEVYRKDHSWTYCLGPYPSFHCLEQAPERVQEIILDESFHECEKAEAYAKALQLPLRYERKSLERISGKKDCYMALKLRKKEERSFSSGTHVILEEVRDMGNLGTIMRTMAALSCFDLVLIGNCCDAHHPKVLRASMGSYADLRVGHFTNFADYRACYPDRLSCAFALTDEALPLSNFSLPAQAGPLALCFGNEGAGIRPETLQQMDQVLQIEQSHLVDSLNLPIALALGLYHVSHASRNGKRA